MQILILKLAWIETFTIDPAGLFGRIYMESSERNVAYAYIQFVPTGWFLVPC